MKQKIKEALQQEYKNLGLNDEAFERVAAFGETFGINDETLANFVKGANDILKKMQSDADKVRNANATTSKQVEELKAKLAEAEAKLTTPTPKPQEENPNEGLAKLLEDKLTALVQPLKDELANIKNARNAEDAFKSAKDYFFSLDYGKKYPDERDEAWERAVEINAERGNKMTAEELQSKAIGYLNKYSAKRGVSDSTKPFASEGGVDEKPDFKKHLAYLEDSGKIEKEKTE
jgi:hypothetical protein